MAGQREGSLEAPTRHPLGHEKDEFWDEGGLFSELEQSATSVMMPPLRKSV